MPNAEGCIVEICGLGRVTGAGCLPRRSPSAIYAGLIAEQVKLEHPTRANAAECGCLRFETQAGVSDGELQARIVVGLRLLVGDDVVVQSIVEASRRISHHIAFGE